MRSELERLAAEYPSLAGLVFLILAAVVVLGLLDLMKGKG